MQLQRVSPSCSELGIGPRGELAAQRIGPRSELGRAANWPAAHSRTWTSPGAAVITQNVKRSSLWLLPLLLAVMVGGSFYSDRQAAKGDRELNVYVTGGQRMAAGEQIYAKPFTYPPFAAVPFVPFAKLPVSWHPSAWFVVNFLILVAMIRWLHRYASGEETGRSPPKLWLFWVLTAVFGGRHVVSVFTNQSHDLTIAGLVMLTAVSWCGHKRIFGMWAGIWAGLGAATKATPLIFLGLFGLRLHWLGVLANLLTTVGATLLPDYVFPRADGVAWWRSWYDVNLAGLKLGGTAEAAGAWNSHSVLNQGLSGAMRRLFTAVEVPDGNFVVGDKGHVLLFEMSATMTKVATLVMFGFVLGVISMCVLFAKRAGARHAVEGRARQVDGQRRACIRQCCLEHPLLVVGDRALPAGSRPLQARLAYWWPDWWCAWLVVGLTVGVP